MNHQTYLHVHLHRYKYIPISSSLESRSMRWTNGHTNIPSPGLHLSRAMLLLAMLVIMLSSSDTATSIDLVQHIKPPSQALDRNDFPYLTTPDKNSIFITAENSSSAAASSSSSTASHTEDTSGETIAGLALAVLLGLLIIFTVIYCATYACCRHRLPTSIDTCPGSVDAMNAEDLLDRRV